MLTPDTITAAVDFYNYKRFEEPKQRRKLKKLLQEFKEMDPKVGHVGWSPDFQPPDWREQFKKMADNVNHPSHYGGKDHVYEAIKVIEAHGLNFNLGNVLKYVLRAGKKGSVLEDLKKAQFYLNREVQALEQST